MENNGVASQPSAPGPPRDRVLIADDEPAVLQALFRLLSQAGYDVDTAESGSAALEKIAQQQPLQLLITDYWMSNVNGPAILTAAAEARPHMPCLALTGSVDHAELIDCLNSGLAARVMLKPWDDRSLLRAIADLIDGARARHEREDLLTLVHEQQAEIERLRALIAQLRGGDAGQITSDDTVQDLIALLAFLLDSRGKNSGQSKRVAELSSSLAVASGLQEEDVRQVEAAALLKDIAQIAAHAPNSQQGSGLQEGLAPELQPLIAGEILKRISGFEDIAEMVKQLQLNASGSGGDTQGLSVPSQILALAESFDREMYPDGRPSGARPSSAVRMLEEQAGKSLSPELVQLFRQQVLPTYIGTAGSVLEIAAYDLEPGMILARDVLNIQGVPLLAAGTVLDTAGIQHLRDNDGFSPLLSRVYIRASSLPLAPGEEDVQTAFQPPDSPAPQPEVVPPASPQEASAQARPMVVVIDDERSVVAALKRELNSAGYTVIGFTNPAEGLDYIRQGGEALAVISDYMMPGMLGSTLLMRIQTERPELPCIVITAHATQDTINRLAKSAHMVRLLKKPWDKQQLLDTLETFK